MFARTAALPALSGEIRDRRMAIRRLDSRRDALPLLSEGRQAQSRQSGPKSRFSRDFGRRRGRHRRRDGGFWVMTTPNPSIAKFRLGHIVATPNALTRLAAV